MKRWPGRGQTRSSLDKPYPHIRKRLLYIGSTAKCVWVCGLLPCDSNGYGDTPTEAYEAWINRYYTLTRTPRAGRWNKRDVLDWYRYGCPPINSFIGGAKIVGYDRGTDSLILRGY